MVADLHTSAEERSKIMQKDSTFSQIFLNKISKWRFENDKSKYVELMKNINEYFKSKGLMETVFRDPENYEVSYEDYYYFYSDKDKTIPKYMQEEEERCLVAKLQVDETNNSPKTICFGNFFQADSQAKEPIEWIILKQEEDKALVISRDCLDCDTYFKNSTGMNDWAKSDIRFWLNNSFYSEAFNENEKNSIVDNNDKLFLLDEGSAKRFFGDNHYDLRAKPSNYALHKGARTDKDGYAWWWLAWHQANIQRSFVPTVSVRGSMGLRMESNRQGVCIRPAMWIKT